MVINLIINNFTLKVFSCLLPFSNKTDAKFNLVLKDFDVLKDLKDWAESDFYWNVESETSGRKVRP